MMFYLHLLSKYGYSSISSHIATQESHYLMPLHFRLVLSSGYRCLPCTPHALISLCHHIVWHAPQLPPLCSMKHLYCFRYRVFLLVCWQQLLSCLVHCLIELCLWYSLFSVLEIIFFISLTQFRPLNNDKVASCLVMFSVRMWIHRNSSALSHRCSVVKLNPWFSS